MTDISSNCSFWFWFSFLLAVQRQWDSSEQDPCVELQDPDFRCAVKRLFSGTLQLPRLSCRPSRPEAGPRSSTSAVGIRPSRSLGTLTSYISRALWVSPALCVTHRELNDVTTYITSLVHITSTHSINIQLSQLFSLSFLFFLFYLYLWLRGHFPD